MVDKLIIIEKNNEYIGSRLDKFLLNKLSINRSQIKKYISNENILVNEKKVKAGYILKENDQIFIYYEDELKLIPQKIDFNILYEDEYIAVISKPQNLIVHPGAGHFEDTLVNGLLYRFNSLATTGEEFRPGIVHRLDKDTSGLMIIAKQDIAYERLVDQFKNSEIHKEYLAIVEGVIDSKGRIEEPIGRDPRNRTKMAVVYENSKNAITEYEVLKNYNLFTLIKVRILTGRTHQIRVHMSYIKHPVLGDLTYGHKNKYKIDKQMLHAYKLIFNHPITNEKIEITDDYPIRFEKFLKRGDI
ncbi:RluA family pseudouridine synthase [Peptoniphilus stercorisuis]|uniref:Pseudouridine synthase n=1 Tax=Peptoniphilus stercorisuis TaxID=1436965 RepID=A0ABS4KBR1_9FIRM|nr:RluA family pseudouridine synthase [Peptoniphilus stercorisuis]MBP2025212.1 23S rRNA pseudouridine1911/1915/1917 synthase [Peptoniphilus stercorisuis]